MIKQINPNLSDEQKAVLLHKGTEAPFSGALLYNESKGTYTCANCSAELFKSSDKYESTTPGLIGWPSFSDTLPNAVRLQSDNSMGMVRQEAVCANCRVHLGHYFDDPSAHNGKHFCINSLSLNFTQSDKS